MKIYIHKDDTRYSPYSLEQANKYIYEGNFSLNDPACHDGQNWETLYEIPGIKQSVANGPSTQEPEVSQTKKPNRNTLEKFNRISEQTRLWTT